MRSVARRYAQAFIELAEEAGTVDPLAHDLESFNGVATGNDNQLYNVLANPIFTQAERRNVLDAVLGKMSLNGLTNNLLRLMLEKGRFGAVPYVVEAYTALADERANRARVEVTSAQTLDDAMQADVKKALETLTGKSVILTVSVDPSLIGGMVARVGSTVYDSSIKSRLLDVKSDLLSQQIQF